MAYAAECLRWYAEEAVRVTGAFQAAPSGVGRILVLRQPVGMAVLVTPWAVVSDPAAPFAGVEESGLGRDGGHEGHMLEYIEAKYVVAQW